VLLQGNKQLGVADWVEVVNRVILVSMSYSGLWISHQSGSWFTVARKICSCGLDTTV